MFFSTKASKSSELAFLAFRTNGSLEYVVPKEPNTIIIYHHLYLSTLHRAWRQYRQSTGTVFVSRGLFDRRFRFLPPTGAPTSIKTLLHTDAIVTTAYSRYTCNKSITATALTDNHDDRNNIYPTRCNQHQAQQQCQLCKDGSGGDCQRKEECRGMAR